MEGGFEEEESRVVHLSEPVDSEQAFRAILEYMYLGDYSAEFPNEKKSASFKVAYLHVCVFAMASRLCMDELEALVFKKLKAFIKQSDYERKGRAWRVGNVVKMVDWVYSYTPSPEPEKVEEPEVDEEMDDSMDEESDDFYEDIQGLLRIISDCQETSIPGGAVPERSTRSNTKKGSKSKAMRSSDKMRKLMARYCASKIEQLRDDDLFKELVAKHSEFAVDVLLAVKNGDEVGCVGY